MERQRIRLPKDSGKTERYPTLPRCVNESGRRIEFTFRFSSGRRAASVPLLWRQLSRHSFVNGSRLILLFASLLAIPLASQSCLHALFFAGLQIVGVTLYFLDNVLLLYFPLKPAQRIFERLAFLYANLCQPGSTSKPAQMAQLIISKFRPSANLGFSPAKPGNLVEKLYGRF